VSGIVVGIGLMARSKISVVVRMTHDAGAGAADRMTCGTTNGICSQGTGTGKTIRETAIGIRIQGRIDMTGLTACMDPGLDVGLIMTAGTVGGIGRGQCSAMGVAILYRMAGIGKVRGQGHMTFRTVSGAASQVIRSAAFQGSVIQYIGMAEGTIGNSIISMDGDHNIAGTMTRGTLR
jgi:hypothetical protein